MKLNDAKAAIDEIKASGEIEVAGCSFCAQLTLSFMAGAGASTVPDLHATYSIIVECKGERQQVQLLKRFQTMGLAVKAIVT